MTTATSGIATELVDAICARDFAAARDLLHAEIDFRAMTPRRTWEAEGPADVESHLRTWLADPEEEVSSIEPVAQVPFEDTLRVGWRVRGRKASGPFAFEQLAYVRERDGQVGWMRLICSGPRPTG
jgi:hypothetical protein